MIIVPLQPLPSQTLKILLHGQSCAIAVYQKQTQVYLDLAVGTQPIVSTALMRNRVRIVREAYLGFVGDLAIVDLEGDGDPTYVGLGSRYQLVYLAPEDLA